MPDPVSAQDNVDKEVDPKRVTLFLAVVESYGQMYEAGFHGRYFILEWNDWTMYDGLEKFETTLQKSKGNEKRIVLWSWSDNKIYEHTFSTEMLSARIMDYNDNTGQQFEAMAAIYEEWKKNKK